MSSLLWYCCLAAAGLITSSVVIYVKRHVYKVSTLIIFYAFSTCMTWIGEFIVLGLFDGYAYKPGVFTDPWAENLTGHLLLNTTMWPAAAVLVEACRLGYGWYPLVIAFFVLPEYLFLSLGIYEQHWWRYYMSVIIAMIFLGVVKKWFPKISRTVRRTPRTIVFYFVGFLVIHFPVPFLLLAGKQYYSLAWADHLVGNMYRSSTLFIFTYQLFEAFLLIVFVCILGKWYWKLAPFAVAAGGQLIMAKLDIAVFQNGWKLLYTIAVYAVCLSVFILLERYTLRPVKEPA